MTPSNDSNLPLKTPLFLFIKLVLRLNLGGRREKYQIERDGCLSLTTVLSSALAARKKCIRRASGVGGIILVNG